jgi:hypothetical protein
VPRAGAPYRERFSSLAQPGPAKMSAIWSLPDRKRTQEPAVRAHDAVIPHTEQTTRSASTLPGRLAHSQYCRDCRARQEPPQPVGRFII